MISLYMDPPFTYQEILSLLIKSNEDKTVYEEHIKQLKQQIYNLKKEVETVKSNYATIKRNELLLISVLEKSKM